MKENNSVRIKFQLSGFSLIELLVTMVIVGILAAVGFSSFSGYNEKAKNAKNAAECAQVQKCELIRTTCEESGKPASDCESLCDISALSCEGGPLVYYYPSSSYWTAESCFATLSGGRIRGYSASCNEDELIIPQEVNGDIVRSIYSFAFLNKGVTSLVLPPNVTSLGKGAFMGNGLTSVALPDGFRTFGRSAFMNNKLTEIYIPDSVKSIGSNAFSGNRLASLRLPNSVTFIDSSAFSGNQLTSVYIPDSVTEIDRFAFRNNPLESVSLKAGTVYPSDVFPPNCTVANGCVIERP